MTYRVKLSRAKGWRMPENTVNCARGPGRKLGNPFTLAQCKDIGFLGSDADLRAHCVEGFHEWLVGHRSSDWWQGPQSDAARSVILSLIPSLRGKNLACWCPLDQPCHTDVLLKLANAVQE